MKNPILFIEENKDIYEVDISGKCGKLVVTIIKQNNKKICGSFMDNTPIGIFSNLEKEEAEKMFTIDIILIAVHLGHFLYEINQN